MRLKRNKVGGILVMAGIEIMGTAYSPVPKPRASREFISQVYARPTGQQRWFASEARKKEILINLQNAKRNVRAKAATFYIDRNTKVTGITAKEKLIVHSMKLMSQIADCKNCKA